MAAALTCAVAAAQTSPSNDDLQTTANLLFMRQLAKPDDLDATFKFAQIEEQLGDYESAIGALERMLFYNKNLPRVKLELGALYFRLRSYETARTYFKSAIEGANVPQEVQEQVALYLTAIDRAVSINQFSAFGQTGVRYQSNANAGPNSATVEAVGQSALLSGQFQRTPDWNAFGLTTGHYFYDFGDQQGNGWEADWIAYYAKQFRVTRFDLGFAEVTTGPRLSLGEYGGMTIHPYAIGDGMLLGGADYLGAVGFGASVRADLGVAATLTPGVEFRDRRFYNSANYPTASGQSGDQWIGYLLGSGSIASASGLGWQARVALTSAGATYAPYAYTDISVDVGLPYSFTAPAFAHTSAPWVFTPAVGYSYTPYREPDPIVNPSVTRRDNQWRVGATLDMSF